jgi:hypothetical protein
MLPWPSRCAALFVLAGACTSEGHTLLVDLRTDLVAGLEFVSVETAANGGVPMTAPAFVGDAFADGRRVAEIRDVEGQVLVVVRLLAADGSETSRRRIQVDVASDVGITVVITRSCLGVSCPGAGDSPSATECLGAACVDPRCTVEMPELCGPAACTAATDCPAAPAACAESRCIQGTCLAVGNDALCTGDDLCRADIGCVPRPAEADGGLDAGTPDAGPRDAGPPPDLMPLATGMADVVCDLIEPCLAVSADKAIGTDCVANATQTLLSELAPMILAAYERGTLEIDPGNFDSCIDAYRALGCRAFESRGPARCSAALRGLVPSGAPCNYNIECEPGLFCDSSTSCPGSCVPIRSEGLACTSDNACVDGLVCEDGACSRPDGDGAPCSSDALHCEAGTQCIVSTCRRIADVYVAEDGEACDVGTPRLCRFGLACVDEASGSFCRPLLTASGAACRRSITDACIPGEACDAASGSDGTCVPLPSDGEPCLMDGPRICQAMHECVAGTCERKGLTGTACTAGVDCLSATCSGMLCAVPQCVP